MNGARPVRAGADTDRKGVGRGGAQREGPSPETGGCRDTLEG